jgi:hypothetical protein
MIIQLIASKSMSTLTMTRMTVLTLMSVSVIILLGQIKTTCIDLAVLHWVESVTLTGIMMMKEVVVPTRITVMELTEVIAMSPNIKRKLNIITQRTSAIPTGRISI